MLIDFEVVTLNGEKLKVESWVTQNKFKFCGIQYEQWDRSMDLWRKIGFWSYESTIKCFLEGEGPWDPHSALEKQVTVCYATHETKPLSSSPPQTILHIALPVLSILTLQPIKMGSCCYNRLQIKRLAYMSVGNVWLVRGANSYFPQMFVLLWNVITKFKINFP